MRIIRLLLSATFGLALTFPAIADPPYFSAPQLGRVPLQSSTVKNCVVQADEKILVSGDFNLADTTPVKGLIRLHPTGALDTTFNYALDHGPHCILALDDGKTLIAGEIALVQADATKYIVRLNADGSHDSTFLAEVNAGIQNLALQHDGKILVAGAFTTINSQAQSRIARLNPDGSLDTTFSPELNGPIFMLMVQPDGKILISGDFSTINSTACGKTIRLNLDGSHDTTFQLQNAHGFVCGTYNMQHQQLILGEVNSSGNGGFPKVRFYQNDGTEPNPNGFFDIQSPIDSPESYGYSSVTTQAGNSGATFFGGSFGVTLVYGPQELDNSFSCTGTTFQKDGTLLMYGSVFNGTSHYAHLGRQTEYRIEETIRLADNDTKIEWYRGNAAECNSTQFHHSSDGGLTWTSLGAGTYSVTDEIWELTPSTMPATGLLRVRASIPDAGAGRSRSIFETVVDLVNDIALNGQENGMAETEILDGSTTVSTANNTHFGIYEIGNPFPGGNTQTYWIENKGVKDLVISSILFTGTDAADFDLSGIDLPYTLPGQAKVSFLVEFLPSVEGVKSATAEITSNDADEAVFDFAVQGIAGVPRIRILGNGTEITNGSSVPNLVDHTLMGSPTVATQYQYVEKQFVIENIGTANIKPSQYSFIQPAAGFSFQGLTFGLSIPPGASHPFTLRYTPQAPGVFKSTFLLTTNADNHETFTFDVEASADTDIKLFGNNYQITNGDSTPSISDGTNFQTVSVANGSKSTPFSIRNDGTAPLTVNSLWLEGDHSQDFTSNTTVPFTIPAKASHSFNVVFNPSEEGLRTATVRVLSNDTARSSFTFDLQGTGVDPHIALKGNNQLIAPGDVSPDASDKTDFLAVPVNGTQPLHTFTIQNTGGLPLTVTQINKSSPQYNSFTIAGITLPVTIPANGSTTFTVKLVPLVSGIHSCTLTLVSNDPAMPQFSFQIQGTGVYHFVNANTIPITASSLGFSSPLHVSLGFAPLPGTRLRLASNTGTDVISSPFSNLEQGHTFMAIYNGQPYYFVADYYGGDGNDMILHWKGTRPYGWGENALGRVGVDSTTDQTAPAYVHVFPGQVTAGKTVLRVVAGGSHSLALLSDGTVMAWGDNGQGQLGVGTVVDHWTPVPVSTDPNFSALHGKYIVAIAAGLNFSLALSSEGKVYAWGDNYSRQTGDGVDTGANRLYPVAVDDTSSSSALRYKSVVRIFSGPAAWHSFALCSDGTLAAWGRNTAKCLGNNTTTANYPIPVNVPKNGVLAGKEITSLSAGLNFSVALCSDGSIATWGDNATGKLGIGTTADSPTPVTPGWGTLLSGGKFISSIAAGEAHVLALRNDGNLLAWGANTNGKLGNDTTANELSPYSVTNHSGSILGTKTVVQIAAGENHSYALCSDGVMTAWGHNASGQVGIGSTSPTSQKVPAPVSAGDVTGSRRYSSITSGLDHAHALVGEASVTDVDGDGMPDAWELAYLTPVATYDDLLAFRPDDDADSDDVVNLQEYLHGSNPLLADTDNDGLPDYWEIAYGLAPNHSVGAQGPDGDSDGDGQSNLVEYYNNTPPNLANADPGFRPSTNPDEPNPESFELVFEAPQANIYYEEGKNTQGQWMFDHATSNSYLGTYASYYAPFQNPSLDTLINSLSPPLPYITGLGVLPLNTASIRAFHHETWGNTAMRANSWDRRRVRLKSNVNLPQGYDLPCVILKTTVTVPLAPQTVVESTQVLKIEKNRDVSQVLPVQNIDAPPYPNSTSPEIINHVTKNVYAMEAAPDVLAVNTNFDESDVAETTNFAIPDCENGSLKAARDHLDGKWAEGDIVTEGLHKGFFGLRPGTWPYPETAGAVVKIKKLDKVDPETGHKQSGHVRLYAVHGTGSIQFETKFELYDRDTLVANDLGPQLYSQAPSLPITYYLEGVAPGKITLEFSYQKGSTNLKYEQEFLVATHKTEEEWREEVRYQIKLQTGNPTEGNIIDINNLDPSEGFTGASMAQPFWGPNAPILYQYYYYYAQHYKQHPEKQMWAGMAKVAGAEIIAGMNDMEQWVEAPVIGNDPGSRKFLCDFLVTGARAIFSDMGWAHLAYTSSGIWAIQHVYDLDDNAVDIAAWVAVDDGIQNQNASQLRKGARILLQREQAVIMQPYYSSIAPVKLKPPGGSWAEWLGAVTVPLDANGMAEIGEWMSANSIKNPIPGGPGLRTVVPGGRLDNYTDRWKWIDDPGQGMLHLWTGHSTLGPNYSPYVRANHVNLSLRLAASFYSFTGSESIPDL